MPEVVKRPQEPLGGIFVDLDRLLNLPLVVAKANKDEIVPVQSDAEHRIERVAVSEAHVIEPLLDLIDDFLAAG